MIEEMTEENLTEETTDVTTEEMIDVTVDVMTEEMTDVTVVTTETTETTDATVVMTETTETTTETAEETTVTEVVIEEETGAVLTKEETLMTVNHEGVAIWTTIGNTIYTRVDEEVVRPEQLQNYSWTILISV
jgi:hypothetical protein